MTVTKDKVVSIHYTLTNDDGKELDSSVGSSPLEYLHGRGYLLKKLEEQIEGKNPGDKFTADLEAKDGYGVYNEDLVVDVPRSDFETNAPLEVGMQFQAATEDGNIAIVTIKKVTDTTVTVDGNHELAGVNLHFSIEIVDVRDATREELDSGMVGGGCSCGGGCGGDCSCDGGCGGGCGCN